MGASDVVVVVRVDGDGAGKDLEGLVMMARRKMRIDDYLSSGSIT